MKKLLGALLFFFVSTDFASAQNVTITPTLAALAAYGATSPAVGQTYVTNYGIYTWASSCPGTADGTFLVSATGVATGCWVLWTSAYFNNIELAQTAISGNSLPTTGAILAPNNNHPNTFFLYSAARDDLILGFNDGSGFFPNPTGNFDTLIGLHAGTTLTTATETILIGAGAGQCITTGSYNVALGDNALGGNDSCSTTTAGTLADSVIVGYYAGSQLINGAGFTTMVGYFAGEETTTGTQNTFFGAQAGRFVTTGSNNTSVGVNALESTSGTPLTGNFNTAFGNNTAQNLQGSAQFDTFMGYNSGNSATTATSDTFMGGQSGQYVSTATQETFEGENAGRGSSSALATGSGNTSLGYESGFSLQGTATGNTTFGASAGSLITTANNNLILGYRVASTTLTTGTGNILLGNNSNCDTPTSSTASTFTVCAASGATHLLDGSLIPGSLSLTDNGTFLNPGIGSDSGHTDNAVCEDTTTHLYLAGSGTGGLCLGSSSKRYKIDAGPFDAGLSQIEALEPRVYRYKTGYGDGGALPQYGFYAEEVEKALPRVVHKDAQGRPNSVDYVAMVPVLVHAIQQLQAEHLADVRRIAALENRLRHRR